MKEFLVVLAANLASVAVVGGALYALRAKIKAQIFSDASFLITQASQSVGQAIASALAQAQQQVPRG